MHNCHRDISGTRKGGARANVVSLVIVFVALGFIVLLLRLLRHGQTTIYDLHGTFFGVTGWGPHRVEEACRHFSLRPAAGVAFGYPRAECRGVAGTLFWPARPKAWPGLKPPRSPPAGRRTLRSLFILAEAGPRRGPGAEIGKFHSKNSMVLRRSR